MGNNARSANKGQAQRPRKSSNRADGAKVKTEIESCRQKEIPHDIAHIAAALPAKARKALRNHKELSELIEVVIEKDKPPLARFPSGDVVLSHKAVTTEDYLALRNETASTYTGNEPVQIPESWKLTLKRSRPKTNATLRKARNKINEENTKQSSAGNVALLVRKQGPSREPQVKPSNKKEPAAKTTAPSASARVPLSDLFTLCDQYKPPPKSVWKEAVKVSFEDLHRRILIPEKKGKKKTSKAASNMRVEVTPACVQEIRRILSCDSDQEILQVNDMMSITEIRKQFKKLMHIVRKGKDQKTKEARYKLQQAYNYYKNRPPPTPMTEVVQSSPLPSTRQASKIATKSALEVDYETMCDDVVKRDGAPRNKKMQKNLKEAYNQLRKNY